MKSAKLHEFQKLRFYKYSISAFIIGLATFIQQLLWKFVQPAPFIFYFPAIILASIYGSGVFAIILTVLCAQYFFFEPYYSFQLNWPQDFIRHAVFFISAYMLNALVKKEVKSKLEAESALEIFQSERELREKFVSTLTHDLQTPLTTAKLATQLIVKNPDPENLKKNTDRITHNLNRIENMIRDLLDTNKIRAGKKIPLEVEEMDLCKCLRTISTDLTTIHGDRFLVNIPESVVGFWCQDAIRRITENLCSNAIKYGSETSAVTLTVEEDPKMVHLKIHNLGDTIPHDELELLFKPFERSKFTKGKKGWGLGLTLVKGLTEAQGGRISVTSDETGTTFTVSLPRDVRKYTEET